MTRDELIKKLVENDMDSAQNDPVYMYDVFLIGCKGIKDYTNEELIDEHNERFDEEITITEE